MKSGEVGFREERSRDAEEVRKEGTKDEEAGNLMLVVPGPRRRYIGEEWLWCPAHAIRGSWTMIYGRRWNAPLCAKVQTC